MRIRFDRGTLLFDAPASYPEMLGFPGVRWDARVGAYRAPACRYREIFEVARHRGVRISDAVSGFRSPTGRFSALSLRPYQRSAIDAWHHAGRRGVVVLPTGSGKTRVALAVVRQTRLPALCLVPTRVLLDQWHRAIRQVYDGPVGRLGDGERDLRPITVSTFESAYRRMPEVGDRFGLLVVDEAHHFGGTTRDDALAMCVAGARLGLTATPLRGEGARDAMGLIGPVVYEQAVSDLAGTYLADFERIVVPVELTAEERARYDADWGRFRAVYRAFSWAHPGARWADFHRHAMRTDEGRRGLECWRRARRLLSYPTGKDLTLRRLLQQHQHRRLLVFTADNETAYTIARRHLIMPLTCDIGRAERDEVLERFRLGALRALVSSRVLNEGLDVPDAEVAIVVGGTQGRREHVQRVGRVLRPAPGKRARVFELVVCESREVQLALTRSEDLVSENAAEARR